MTTTLKWRFDILNLLLEMTSASRYLEIGVEDGDSLSVVQCATKHGVDPASSKATHKQTSDEFFVMLHDDYKYGVIFVDGLHVADQALRDIENSLLHLEDDGFIVVHDCNPPDKWHQRSEAIAAQNGFRSWNGDVYKAIIHLRATRTDLHVCVVNTDYGCGVIRKAKTVQPLLQVDHPNMVDMTYEMLDADRHRLLNLVSPDEFLNTWLPQSAKN